MLVNMDTRASSYRHDTLRKQYRPTDSGEFLHFFSNGEKSEYLPGNSVMEKAKAWGNAMGLAWVIAGAPTYENALQYLPGKREPLPSTPGRLKKEAVRLVRSGKLEWGKGIQRSPSLGPLLEVWTPAFLHGVRASEVIISKKAYHLTVQEGFTWWDLREDAKWMIEDLEELTERGGIYLRKAKEAHRGRICMKCPFFHYGDWLERESTECEKLEGSVECLTGLLYGGRKEIMEGGGTKVPTETWLILPSTECVHRILDLWTIPYEEIGRRYRGKFLRVSPFFAGLVGGRMPLNGAMALFILTKVGRGTFWAALYWELVFKGRNRPVSPWSWGLPWGLGGHVAYQRFKRKELHREGLKAGVNRVDEKLAELVREWGERWERRCVERNYLVEGRHSRLLGRGKAL